jgi:hypothetical protein
VCSNALSRAAKIETRVLQLVRVRHAGLLEEGRRALSWVRWDERGEGKGELLLNDTQRACNDIVASSTSTRRGAQIAMLAKQRARPVVDDACECVR